MVSGVSVREWNTVRTGEINHWTHFRIGKRRRITIVVKYKHTKKSKNVSNEVNSFLRKCR